MVGNPAAAAAPRDVLRNFLRDERVAFVLFFISVSFLTD
jgi:hypothetical protein